MNRRREVWNKQVSPQKGKDFWGPPIWTTIHVLAICLRSGTSEAYKTFLILLTRLLPCDYCKKNLTEKLRNHPPDSYLQNSQMAFLYSYIVHDLANQHITKHNPKTPKASVPFDDIRDSYLEGLSNHGSAFWGPAIWTTIHTLAVTLRPENADAYKSFLDTLTVLLPDQESRRALKSVLSLYPIEPYLRNNHDAFFYSYMIHDMVNKKLSGSISPSYDDIKPFYFSALGEECNDCKV